MAAVIICKYHPSRASEHINEFVDGFTGFLQTDGYSGYDCALKTHPAITHVGCFAHARRKFFEAEKCGSQSRPASVALGYIRQLYAIEKELRGKKLSDDKFLKERRERALPVLSAFKEWLDKKYTDTVPSTLLNKAVFYTLNQWEKLTAYLESPYLTPDNNLSENAIRPFVIGRKNWLFYKSPAGAKSACALYSLIETAKLNSLVPSRYLTYLFEYAPRASSLADWQALLPWNVNC